MKTILLLILSAFTAFAATTYPVLTDNANRTFSGGGTNLALLNASQTWTGTPTFPVGFFPSNNIGMRLLWSSPTNIYLPSVTVSPGLSATNNGGYSSTTHFASGVIPPLLSSNSMLVVYGVSSRTNVNASALTLNFYIGPNTNWVGYNQGIGTTVGNNQYAGLGLIMPGGSTTQWIQGGNWASGPVIVGPANFFDSTVSNNIYFGANTSVSFTNALCYGFRIVEVFAP